jgi:hypothetical protein
MCVHSLARSYSFNNKVIRDSTSTFRFVKLLELRIPKYQRHDTVVMFLYATSNMSALLETQTQLKLEFIQKRLRLFAAANCSTMS